MMKLKTSFYANNESWLKEGKTTILFFHAPRKVCRHEGCSTDEKKFQVVLRWTVLRWRFLEKKFWDGRVGKNEVRTSMQSKYMLENTRRKKRDSRIGLAMGLAYGTRVWDFPIRTCGKWCAISGLGLKKCFLKFGFIKQRSAWSRAGLKQAPRHFIFLHPSLFRCPWIASSFLNSPSTSPAIPKKKCDKMVNLPSILKFSPCYLSTLQRTCWYQFIS